MKLPFMTLAAGAFLAVSCANAATATDNYTVTLPLSEDEDGLTAYIIDFDTSAKLDSTVVDGGKAIFKGTVTTPVFARVILDGNRAGQFVLEEGDIAFNPANRMAAGSPTNDALVNLMSEQQKFVAEYRQLGDTPDDKAKRKRYSRAITICLKTLSRPMPAIRSVTTSSFSSATDMICPHSTPNSRNIRSLPIRNACRHSVRVL